MSIVLRDVGPSLVGGLVLPHEGTIQPKRIRHAGDRTMVIVIVILFILALTVIPLDRLQGIICSAIQEP